MKQFSTILKFELKYYLKNKIFVGITVFLVILIIAVMSLPRLIEFFTKDEPTPDTSIDILDPDINEGIGDNSDVTSNLPVMLIKSESSEKSEVIKRVFRPMRAAASAASHPACPPPTMITSYVVEIFIICSIIAKL